MLIVGLDLTDPYARAPRPIDVAVLDPTTAELRFPDPLAWSGRARLAIADMADEIARRFSPTEHALVIDGPQALASSGRSVRACEVACRAPGRTPDHLPTPGSKPFAGYVRGSAELWLQLLGSPGWRLPAAATGPGALSVAPGDLYEAFPGDIWRILAGRDNRLERKTSRSGQQQRIQLLRHLGFHLVDERPLGHDRLDAAVCAVVGGWAAHQASARARVELLGEPASWDDSGTLREGQMLRPVTAVGARPDGPTIRVAPPSGEPTRRPSASGDRTLAPGEAWGYRATRSAVDGVGTFELAQSHHVIWRPARSSS